MSQKSLFPSIDVENKHTLFIIGNGFDLAHEIKSQYSDFAKWVRQQGNDRLVQMMEIFFSNNRDFWGDIEKALGEYDEKEIVDWCSPDEGVDYDHPTRSVAAIEDGPDWLFKPILDEFLEAFNQWVESIDMNEAKAKFDLPAESHYLTLTTLRPWKKSIAYLKRISSMSTDQGLNMMTISLATTSLATPTMHMMTKQNLSSNKIHGAKL